MLVMLGLVLLLAAGLGGGFYLHIRNLIANAPKPAPATVSTIKVEPLDWQPQITAVANLTAVNGVDVTNQVAGIVSEILVESGSVVKAGDEIIKLNSDPDQAQLRSLRAASELSAVTLKRDQTLLSQRVTSQSTIDTEMANLKSKTALAQQQESLIAQKTIRAPFAGKVGVMKINLGQYLSPGAAIVTLQDLSAMHADFLVPQDQIAELAVGQSVNVVLDAFPGRKFPGAVAAIDAKVDPNTRNLTVRATISNPGELLRPGMFVRAIVDIGNKQQRLTLPQTAITYNSYGTTVFVLRPAQQAASGPTGQPPAVAASGLVAQQIFVTTGDSRGDQVAIVKGLEAGQEVVTSGQLKLKSGTPVVVDNSVQPANEPNPAPQEQ